MKLNVILKVVHGLIRLLILGPTSHIVSSVVPLIRRKFSSVEKARVQGKIKTKQVITLKNSGMRSRVKMNVVEMIFILLGESICEGSFNKKKMSLDGLEPSTPSLKVRCSNQLS